MFKGSLLLFLTFYCCLTVAQITNPDSLKITEVRASETDTNIDFELSKHYTFYNTTTDPRWEKSLVVYLPGSFDVPQNTLLFPTVAANKGHHVVSLKYENSVAAKTACSNSTDSNCFAKYRQEIITGEDLSDKVEVDETNSIENRLLKLIIHLNTNRPNEGWDIYLENGDLVWNKIIVAGHSQGGGHAAYMGLTKPLKRVLMFSSPNDWSDHFNAPAKWTTQTKATRTDSYFAFGALNDDVVDFSKQYQVWQSLGLKTVTDTTLADENQNINMNTRMMYTKFDKAGLSVNHNSTVRDSDTPLDMDGKPVFEYVWQVMLGIDWIPGNIATPRQSLEYYPNPAHDRLQLPALKEANITITNSLGQLALNTTISQGLINIKHLKSGIYHIQAQYKNTIYTATFIKR